jgi:hypothetical protein
MAVEVTARKSQVYHGCLDWYLCYNCCNVNYRQWVITKYNKPGGTNKYFFKQ